MADEQPVAGDKDARQTIARLTNETLPRLIERLTNSELGELEVREDGWRIRLRRANGNSEAVADGFESTQRAPAAPGHTGSRERPAPITRAYRPDAAPGLVTSPGVGYFAPRDGIAAGFKIGRGDVLGHVDVLGVKQEVVAPVDGVVGVIEVEAGQAVEYGQPLARVEPEQRIEARVEA